MKALFRPARLLVVAAAVAVAGLAMVPAASDPVVARGDSGLASADAHPQPAAQLKRRPTPTPSTPAPSRNPASALTPSPPPPDSATAFQGGATHTGVTTGDTLQPAIARRWTRDLAASVSYPLIAQGLIFVTTGHTDQTGLGQSSAAQLWALSQATGQTVWGPVAVGDGDPWANATYDGGRVFTVDRKGVMRAFDAASGTPAWTTTLPYASLGYEAAPTAINGHVYTDGGNNEVVAVNESDGSIAWTTVNNGGGHFSDPAVTSDGVYVCFGGGVCFKFDPATGNRLWSHTTCCSGGGGVAPVVAGGKVWGPAALAGQSAPVLDAATGVQVGTWAGTANPAIDVANGIGVFYTFGGAIQGIDLASGAVLWTFAEDSPAGTPEIANGFVYISTAASTLYVLDERTGRQVQYDYTFAAQLGGAGGQGSLAEPWGGLGIGQGLLAVPAGNQLWVYSSSGSPPAPPPTFTPIPNQADQATAIGIDPAHSGGQPDDQLAPPLKPVWTVNLNGSVAYPLIANGMIFALVGEPFNALAPVAGARLYAFDLASGRQLWGPLETGGRDNNGSLAYDQGRLFVVNGSGWVKAFDSRSGVKLWAVPLQGSLVFNSPVVALNGTVYVNVDPNNGGGPAVIDGIDAATGAIKWTQNVSGGGGMSPVVTATDVFSAKCGQVADFDAGSGVQRWAIGSIAPCAGGATPVLSQGRLYAHAADTSGSPPTIAYDAASGAQLGTFPTTPAPPAFDGAGRGFFLVRVFGTGPPPALEAHDVTTGKLLWSFGGDGQLVSNPVTANGFVYVASMSGTLYVLDAATGTQVWSGSVGSSVVPTQDVSAGEPEPALAVGQGALAVPNSSSLTVLTGATSTVRPPGGSYHAVAPYRIVDTRIGMGGSTLGPGSQIDVQVSGTGGTAGVPAGATAAVLNVTATDGTAASFLTVWPAGQSRPFASNLNFRSGETIPNLVVASLGSGGGASVYNLAGTVDVVIDVEGWFSAPAAPPSAGRLVPVVPYRIVDTRIGQGGSTIGAAQQIDVQVAGTGGAGGVPVSAAAVVLNITVTNPTAASYLTVWPTGQPRPLASNLNFVPGQTIPNRAFVQLGSGGKVSIYNSVGTTDVVVDVNAWITDTTAAASGSGLFTGVAPVRVLDTRLSPPALGPGGQRTLTLGGAAGVPPGATAVALNVTVTNPTTASYLTAWPSGASRPLASDLNFGPGDTIPNLVVVKLSAAGQVSFYNSSGTTDVVVDLEGWYS